jgi:hypothetical protein
MYDFHERRVRHSALLTAWMTLAVTGCGESETAPADAAAASSCLPCQTSADCGSGSCVFVGDASFCAPSCQGGCAAGTTCRDSEAVAGGLAPVCVPDSGACSCPTDGSGGIATCRAGACRGTATCSPVGLGTCSASAPEVEACGGGDEDCDGETDETNAVGCVPQYVDGDGDTFGTGDAVCMCGAPAGWATRPGDCDDAAKSIHPEATETCNGQDDDCDGTTDAIACDDGDPCTSGDACAAGVCAGKAACDDGNDCTADVCAPGGGCTYEPKAGGVCQPADPCLQDGTCNAGLCDGGVARVCDDQNPCTQDTCAPDIGCLALPLAIACDDGDPCTRNDSCASGTCAGTVDATCKTPTCGDGACSGAETCATCPVDCSPLGAGVCGAACDPLSPTSACPANFVCAPTWTKAAMTLASTSGTGACGTACATNADCAGGACLSGVGGLVAGGICGKACDPAAPSCTGIETCVAMAGSTTQGVCVAGAACTADGGCDTPFPAACLPLGAAPGGLCLPTCSASTGAPCKAAGLACIARDAPELHGGVCVGAPVPCDALAGTGCPDGQTCAVIGGGFVSGTATGCRAAGSVAAGGACAATRDCAAGLACNGGVCRAYCDTTVGCAGGVCGPIGATGTVGICVTACGDGKCDSGETCGACPADCGACAPPCGDGSCDEGETCLLCALDCGVCAECGDSECNGEERCETCPADCGPCLCGDQVCSLEEDCASCAADCAGLCVCGNGTCDATETCQGCEADCGACTCGDGTCQDTEACGTCLSDCGPCTCGDGACGGTEDCGSCAADCGACACGDFACSSGEGCAECPEDCGACLCGDGTCQTTENCADCASDCGACQCGDGTCSKGETCTACPADCGDCSCGNQTCDPGETCESCAVDCHVFGLTGCKGACDPTDAAGCGANYACGATTAGAIFVPALGLGNSVCGDDCVSDADCASGACVAVRGLEGSGICRPTCTLGVATGCPSGEVCTADLASPGAGVCMRPCTPGAGACIVGEVSTCVALQASANQGMCLRGCYQGNPKSTCPAATTCLVKATSEWHEGTCVGQAVACDPVAQTGCAPGQTCQLVGGLMFSGFTAACTARVGTTAEGGKCVPTVPTCEPGLACVNRVCRRFCALDGPPCPSGTCTDVSASFYRPAGEVAVCQ